MPRAGPLKHPPRAPSLSRTTLGRKLKIQQLMVIAKVIETGSLMRAAGVLGMTQPGVTKSIHDVETFLGASLFERTNRGVTPTELGQAIGARAQAMLSELGYLTDEINAMREGASGRVAIGAMTSASARLLPMALARLKLKVPDLLLTVRDGNSTQLFPALATSNLDIVICRLPDDDEIAPGSVPFRYEELYRETLCIVTGAKLPAPCPANATLADLIDLPWLLPPPESPARRYVERLFAQAGLALPRNRVESTSVLTNIGLLVETPCLGLMPRAAAQTFIDAGPLVALESPPASDFGAVGFAVRADREVSPACYRLILQLRECQAEHVAESKRSRKP